ncbi:LytS/YehU family sensor histidine kinase [Flavobacterium nitrogenifigens]|uniref:LytS/YehU family sensor histidine kinase n=2 Tax=Flavobacterium TaxID=237 RepID=A0A7W7NA43_9FLAO|nr:MULTISPECIES: sensor histidine kinase [Flavobacterium]MBB4804154.1 LytS/YehU family sensor histidine kinase [Flavobacterium nitrogenifigens]MBB6389113.1 LytS/YehU family sensor histidine kinase [Flavobacterium notoginsengisoli]
MKLKIPFYYHIILFLGLFLTYILWDYGINNRIAMVQQTSLYLWVMCTFMLSVFVVYILNFYTVCDRFLNKKKIHFYFLSIPVSLLIFAGVRYFFQEVIMFEITGEHNYYEEAREIKYYIKDNFFFGLPAIILSALSYLFWQSQYSQKQNQELLLENKKAEFQMLKAQVSPHFLFNTLNSFYSQLVLKEDEMADDILVLSDLLRYVITETDKDEAVLSKEIQFIQNYIHLQKKRFEDQLYLDFSVEGEYSNERILSSALIHFVENVFKHGKLNDKEEKALISIQIKKGLLEISTFNYNVNGENYSSTGIGFENLTKRLEYMYKDQFILEKTEENNTFKTYLKIPLKN